MFEEPSLNSGPKCTDLSDNRIWGAVLNTLTNDTTCFKGICSKLYNIKLEVLPAGQYKAEGGGNKRL